jgi:O-antigen/teichoic acid export membrane protein
MTYYLVRSGEADEADERAVVTAGVRLAVIQVGILGCVLLAILAAFHAREGLPDWPLIAAPPLVLLAAITGVQYGQAVLQAKYRFGQLSVLRLLPFVIYSGGLGVAALAGNRQLLPVLLTLTLGLSVAAFATWVVALRSVRRGWLPHRGLEGQLMRFGLRGHLGVISPIDALPVDQALVAVFLSPAALGT